MALRTQGCEARVTAGAKDQVMRRSQSCHLNEALWDVWIRVYMILRGRLCLVGGWAILSHMGDGMHVGTGF